MGDLPVVVVVRLNLNVCVVTEATLMAVGDAGVVGRSGPSCRGRRWCTHGKFVRESR